MVRRSAGSAACGNKVLHHPALQEPGRPCSTFKAPMTLWQSRIISSTAETTGSAVLCRAVRHRHMPWAEGRLGRNAARKTEGGAGSPGSAGCAAANGGEKSVGGAAPGWRSAGRRSRAVPRCYHRWCRLRPILPLHLRLCVWDHQQLHHNLLRGRVPAWQQHAQHAAPQVQHPCPAVVQQLFHEFLRRTERVQVCLSGRQETQHGAPCMSPWHITIGAGLPLFVTSRQQQQHLPTAQPATRPPSWG